MRSTEARCKQGYWTVPPEEPYHEAWRMLALSVDDEDLGLVPVCQNTKVGEYFQPFKVKLWLNMQESNEYKIA
jgi:hypothetical protein